METSIGILLITVGIYSVYKGNFVDSLVITSIYMILIYVSDFFAITLLGYTLGISDMAFSVMQGYSMERAVMIILAKLLNVLVCIWMTNIFRKIYWKRAEAYFFIIFAIVILYCFIQQTFSQTDGNTLLMWCYLLLIVSLSIYSVMRHRTALVEKEKQLLEGEVQYMSEQNYRMYVQNLESNRIFYHDLKNQLILIREYLDNQQYQKAKKYMDNLKIPALLEKSEKITGNEALDILLNYKKKQAEQDEIKILIISEEIKLKLSDHEVVALFGNLLDNAMEACRKFEKDKRKIKLTIRRINDMTFIKISNSCCEPKMENGKFISEKKESEKHGIGLSSIYDIAEKHEGTVSIDYRDNVFEILVSFYSI